MLSPRGKAAGRGEARGAGENGTARGGRTAVRLLSRGLLDELAAKAGLSPRRRAHFNVHATPADLVQRFVVVAQADAYFRPHRHASKSELAVLLSGRVDVLTFDEAGAVTGRYTVGDDTASIAYETPERTWHTLVPGPSGCAFFEVKQGPYDAATASEFAAWAPTEGDAAVPGFLAWLRTARVGERFLPT
jgi:cupin fold WbuC family metalloprotein